MNIMKNIFLILFLLPLLSYSQVQDNFSDGTFTNPLWRGDTTKFTHTAGQLQSNGPNIASSKIYISTANALINNTEWNFLVDLKFAPSSTNYTKIYIVSDTSNLLSNQLNGYYIQIGQSNEDTIKFFKQTGAVSTLLFTGTTRLATATANVKVRIKILRSNIGVWQFFSDKTGGSNFISEGSPLTENTFTSTSFFGITCIYATASRYNLFYFDDFSVSQQIQDLTPPSISSVSVLNQNSIDVLFSENIDSTIARDVNNYTVNNGILQPNSAIWNASNKAKVQLNFTNPFPDGIVDSLIVYNIEDLSGNAMMSDTATFTYFAPVTFLSDSFADGNFTQNPVWTGDDSLFTCIQTLGNYQLRLNATVPKTATLYTPYIMGDSAEWRFFIHLNFSPSSSTYTRVFLFSDNNLLAGNLNGYYLQFGEANNADVIRLMKKSGAAETEICFGTTNISGSFSLNIRVIKSAAGNWKLYTAPALSNVYTLEGTGTDNSITTGSYFGLLAKFSSSTYSDDFYFDNIYAGPIIPDTEPPSIISATPTSQDSVDVLFSENVTMLTAENTSNYFVNNNLNAPISATQDVTNKSLVHLVFANNFPDGIWDTLKVFHVADTHGNAIDTAIARFRYFIIPISFSDNFQDANFTQNPIWIGDDSLYTIKLSGTNYILNSNGTIPKTAKLYTHVAMQDSMEWRMNINMEFAGSSSSYARIYLAADSSVLDTSNAYFLQFGETGDTDRVRLFRQDVSGTKVQICKGTTDISNNFNINIRVTKEADGTWQLFTAPGGSGFYILEGVGFDNTITSTKYFGVYSKYSATSYKDKFFYDNFYTGPIIPDTDPPTLLSATPISATTLDLVFSEDVRLAECTNVANYHATGTLGTPTTAEQDVVNHAKVHLTFPLPFTDGKIDTITVTNMKDNAGNLASPMSAMFQFFIIRDSLFDNFSDGNFNANPIWIGDDSLYTCSQTNGDYMLQLNATNPKTAILYSHVAMHDSMEWRFTIKLDISPSSTTCTKIYLASDSTAFSTFCNGYFVQFGETNATDKIRLVKQTGADTVVVCSGTTDISGPFALNVKITKEADGTWKIFTAPLSSELYVLESIGFDDTPIISRYFGIISKFSSASYKNKFYYDNFYVGRILPDTTAPEILSATATTQYKLDVLFSEDVDLTTCTQTLNYSVTGSIGVPVIAEQDVTDHALVHLTFSGPFIDGHQDTLTVLSMKDNAGNISQPMIIPFIYYSTPNSFTDDFTDGNFTQNPIWLGDDSLYLCNSESGNTVLQMNATIPKTTILYTHLKGVTDTMEWHFDVNCAISLSSTSFAKIYLASDNADLKGTLNGYYLQLGEPNTTDVIRLFRQSGTEITEICAGTTSIADPFNLKIRVIKEGSVWKLYSGQLNSLSYDFEASGTDMFNLNTSYFGLVCKFSSASYNTAFAFDNFYAGAVIPDTVKPFISNVALNSFNAIDVIFSEPVQTTSAQNTANYNLSGGIGNAQTAIQDANNAQMIHLTFSTNLTGGTNYTLTAYNVKDIAGNSTDTATYDFYYEQSPTEINEHFDDGDFFFNPTWNGKIGDFMVTPELQLDLFTVTEIYDTSYISTSVNITTDSCEWQFYTKVNIPPSASNFERFYLMSDNSNLASNIHGYYIQIGENGSNDALILNKQNGSTSTTLLRGTDALVAMSPTIRVKVTHNFNTGEWKIYADATGNTNFQTQGSVVDSTYSNSLFYIGPYMRYSSSNAQDKFYFDDIYCGKVIKDTIAPALTNLTLADSINLDLFFSENLDLTTAGSITNYFTNNGLGTPASAVVNVSDNSKVRLTFSTPALQDINYTITITNIKDTKGNLIGAPITRTFTLHKIQAFDVLINEIMADPSPVVSLPEVEYLELFNRTHVDINLKDWTLTIGNTDKTFPDCKIAADSFLIVTPVGKESLFHQYGRVVGILSNDGLSNSGNTITLYNQNNIEISSVTYSDSWYNDNNKKNGGWSLEQIDPLNPCTGESNWKATTNLAGGTPGKQNSVYTTNPDNSLPQLLHAVLLSTNDSVRLFFNEPLKINTITTAMFTCDNNAGQPIDFKIISPENKSIILRYANPFTSGIIYTITAENQVTDCVGNAIGTDNSCKFGVSQPPAINDIVINEVLFNERPDGVDYVEVYNRSTKVINLKDIRMAMRNETTQLLETTRDISIEGYLLLPGSYDVITTYPEKVKQQYFTINPKNFVMMSSMPSFSNTSGEIVLVDKSLTIIDDFAFNEKMQFELLTSFEGIALERVNFDRQTNDKTNWHSAAQSVGYGTPAYKNSQYVDNLTITDEIQLSPEIFSPDEDGFNDVLTVGYKFTEPGFNATINVYDAKGRLIKKLANNELLATSGTFVWTGIDENNNKAGIGIYIIFAEVFDLNGTVKKFKKTCILAGKLN